MLLKLWKPLNVYFHLQWRASWITTECSALFGKVPVNKIPIFAGLTKASADLLVIMSTLNNPIALVLMQVLLKVT